MMDSCQRRSRRSASSRTSAGTGLHLGDVRDIACGLECAVKHTVGMTGEVTLQGRVLPIGGLKQKVLAAHAAGLTEVILPERNRADLEDVPEDVREAMTFHPVLSIDEVLELALEPAPEHALQAA